MTDRPGDLARMVAQIVWRLDAIERRLGELGDQVARTNGRVSTLELWRARLEGAHAAADWVRPALSGVVAAVVSALLVRLVGG